MGVDGKGVVIFAVRFAGDGKRKVVERWRCLTGLDHRDEPRITSIPPPVKKIHSSVVKNPNRSFPSLTKLQTGRTYKTHSLALRPPLHPSPPPTSTHRPQTPRLPHRPGKSHTRPPQAPTTHTARPHNRIEQHRRRASQPGSPAQGRAGIRPS